MLLNNAPEILSRRILSGVGFGEITHHGNETCVGILHFCVLHQHPHHFQNIPALIPGDIAGIAFCLILIQLPVSALLLIFSQSIFLLELLQRENSLKSPQGDCLFLSLVRLLILLDSPEK